MFMPIFTRRAILAAFFLTTALIPSSATSAQAAADASQPRVEEQIASLEQERAALLAQIQDEDANATTSQSRLSLFMLLGGLIGCAGAALGIITSIRKLQMPAVMSGKRQHPVGQDVGHKLASGSRSHAVPANLPTIEDESMSDQFDPGEVSVGAMEVSECLDPLPQAQFWACMGKPALAIEILEPALDALVTPHGWLLLLEMYTLSGRRSKYHALAQRFKTIFNGQVPAYDDFAVAFDQRRLRDCPDLALRINSMLGKGGGATYLRNLLLDDRNGERRGFEMGVYCDLVRLHDMVCSGKTIRDCEEIYA